MMDTFCSLKVCGIWIYLIKLGPSNGSWSLLIFFLQTPGGRIDQAHHTQNALKALDETVELSLAIERAQSLTNSENTLIVVTSDHSHTMSLNGYPKRGNPIGGLNTHLSEIGETHFVKF